jgi:hypothetical protein
VLSRHPSADRAADALSGFFRSTKDLVEQGRIDRRRIAFETDKNRFVRVHRRAYFAPPRGDRASNSFLLGDAAGVIAISWLDTL